METLKVSVIIPLYNAGEFLKKCLDSVIAQTLTELEIIVINDGSKDNSDDVMQSYIKKEKRIKYVNRENRGVSATRNEGLKIALGEYVAFLDADDWVDNDFYEKLYAKASESKADLVIAPHIVEVFEKSNVKNLNKEYTKDVYLTDLLKGNVEGFVWNKLYKKDFLEVNKIKFPDKEELNYGEDQYFTTRVLVYANIVAFINGTYLHYRYNTGSLVHTYQKNLIADMETLYIKNKELFIDNNKYQEYMKTQLLKVIIGILFNEFKQDNKFSKSERIEQFKKIRGKASYMDALKSLNKNTLAAKDYKMLEMLKDEKLNKLYFFMFLRTKLMQIRTN